jgi:hypothetical protein
VEEEEHPNTQELVISLVRNLFTLRKTTLRAPLTPTLTTSIPLWTTWKLTLIATLPPLTQPLILTMEVQMQLEAASSFPLFMLLIPRQTAKTLAQHQLQGMLGLLNPFPDSLPALIATPICHPSVTSLDPLVANLCGREVGRGSNLFYLLIRQG